MRDPPPGQACLVSLPYDLIREICSLLSGNEISALLSTCHTLHALYEVESIWQELCKRYGVNNAGLFGVNSFRSVYTELLHTYGPLLGLWASDHPYSGSVIEFRIDHDIQGIVGEVWQFWPRGSVTSRPNLPEYSRFMHVSLIANEEGHLHAQLHWRVAVPGEDYYGPGTTSINVPTLHVVSETNQDIIARIPTWGPCRQVSLPDMPPSGNDLWYDRTKELARLKRDHDRFEATPMTMYMDANSAHIVSATSPTVKPAALMIRPPARCAQGVIFVHESRLPFNDFRNMVYPQDAVGWFYRRFYPLRSFFRQGQDPNERDWDPKSLEGLWLGSYGGHGTEVLFLHHNEAGEMQAWKVTGDVNVPRGALSWTIDLNVPLNPNEYGLVGFEGSQRLYRGTGTVCSTGFIEADRDVTENVVCIAGKDEIAIHWGLVEFDDVSWYVRYKGRDITSETKEHLLRRPVGWTP